jgi:hypothetical protein
MKFPLFKTNIRSQIPATDFAGIWKGAVLIMLLIIQATFSSYKLPANGKEKLTMSSIAGTKYAAGEWVLSATVQNVDFFYQITGCNGKQVVLLKFNNRNATKVKVSWKEVFTTQFENGKEGSGKKSLLLSTGETFDVDCSNAKIKECIVLSSHVSPAYIADIRKFGFKDITVNNQ